VLTCFHPQAEKRAVEPDAFLQNGREERTKKKYNTKKGKKRLGKTMSNEALDVFWARKNMSGQRSRPRPSAFSLGWHQS
jgi:hypothetical protein